MLKNFHGQSAFHASDVRQARLGWGIYRWLPTAQSNAVGVLMLFCDASMKSYRAQVLNLSAHGGSHSDTQFV